MLIPIGTDIRTRKPPLGNWLLILLNVLIFVYTDWIGGAGGQAVKSLYMLDPAWPQLWQYLTYQFLHGDLGHLLGNMLFLWIFGDAVCDRMGSLCYVLFYLAGGVFAGFTFAIGADNPILGASGSIAAVTTAFLVLFPRVHITMLVWLFFFITTFQLPSMILIIFKIILWDNIIAPSFGGGPTSSVAYSAHLGGYAFGFSVALLMLAARALPRNQFDMLGLWQRWRRRTGLAGGATGGPHAARPIVVEEMHSRPLEPLKLTPSELLREEILNHLAHRDVERASQLHQRLLELDASQVLPRAQQIEVANHLAQTQRHAEAIRAYEAFLAAYPTATDAHQVRLLVGLIYNRYLRQHAQAAAYLRDALDGLTVEAQRRLAREELRVAESRISGPGPDAT
ncbi:MAG: rhomboid family intramembrane serine protease [Planctomycetes bacterium]|nr:rhomboid family intramembrane serine protease [Planctomycetota bacterium]